MKEATAEQLNQEEAVEIRIARPTLLSRISNFLRALKQKPNDFTFEDWQRLEWRRGMLRDEEVRSIYRMKGWF